MKDYLSNYLNQIDEFEQESITPINLGQQRVEKNDAQKDEQLIILKQDEKPLGTIIKRGNKIHKDEERKSKIVKDSPKWDIYKERVFIKTLHHQRFNYFIIIYAFTTLSAAIVQVKITQAIILTTGFFILGMLWFNLIRVHLEYKEIRNILHKKIRNNNLLNIIEKKVEEHQSFFNQLPINSVLTYGIPSLCLVSILCYLIILLVVV